MGGVWRIVVPSQQFTVSFDLTSKLISGIVSGGLILAAVATQSTVVGVLGLFVLAVAYAYSPRGYSVEGNVLWVDRLAGRARFDLDGLREARLAEQDDLRGCIRLWGNGGLFGYYGLFRTTRLGRCTWYVTNRSRAAILVSGAKTALFSPDDMDGFLAAVRSRAAGCVEGGSRAPADTLFATQSIWSGRYAPSAAGLLVLAFVAVTLFYSPGLPDCTLSPATLTIHDRFYPVTLRAADVDSSSIRVVDFASEVNWRPTLRTGGFGNLRYQSGWFQTADGQKVRLYRAGGQRLVLLPPKGNAAPVLLQAGDPEAFAARVRQSWGAGR